MKGERLWVVCALIVATGAISGVAQAAPPLRLAKLDRELYSFPGGPGGGALLSFTVDRDKPFSRNPNRPQVARNMTLACMSGATPPAGIPAHQAMVLRLPGYAPIVGHRRFAYSGRATAYPVGPMLTTAPTAVVFKFAFIGRVRSRSLLYPTAVRGSFTSGACSSPVSFSFPYL
jgi:hypothetical protein